MPIIKITKTLLTGKNTIKVFRLTSSSNPEREDMIRRENIRLKMLKKGRYIDEDLIL